MTQLFFKGDGQYFSDVFDNIPLYYFQNSEEKIKYTIVFSVKLLRYLHNVRIYLMDYLAAQGCSKSNHIIIENKKPEKLSVIWLNGLCVLFHKYTSSIRSLLCFYYMGRTYINILLPPPILLHCYCRNLIQNPQNNNALTKTNIINQIYNINFFNLSQICQRLCSKL